jgi:hypothetical protein
VTDAVRVRKQTAAHQVVEILTDRIRCGEYTPEMGLPSEDGLAEEFNNGRVTRWPRRSSVTVIVPSLTRVGHSMENSRSIKRLSLPRAISCVCRFHSAGCPSV